MVGWRETSVGWRETSVGRRRRGRSPRRAIRPRVWSIHRGDRPSHGVTWYLAPVEKGSRQPRQPTRRMTPTLRRRRGEVAVTVWRPGKSAEDTLHTALVVRSDPCGGLPRYAPKALGWSTGSKPAVAGQVGPRPAPGHEPMAWSIWAARRRRVPGSSWWRRPAQHLGRQ
jgi:hypothetical protein